MKELIARIKIGSAGVSMMFVLAVVMLLMAIGVSALTAASLNYGTYLTQRSRNQFDLYVSSMEQTVKEALSESTSADDKGAEIAEISELGTLGGRILNYIYDNIDADLDEMADDSDTYDFIFGDDEDIEAITFTSPGTENTDGTVGYEFTIEGEFKVVLRKPDYFYTIDPANPLPDPITGEFALILKRTAQTVIINGMITVTQVTNYTAAGGTQTMTTATTYRYTGGVLAEDFYSGTLDAIDDEDRFEELQDIEIKNPGEWTAVKYEVIG